MRSQKGQRNIDLSRARWPDPERRRAARAASGSARRPYDQERTARRQEPAAWRPVQQPAAQRRPSRPAEKPTHSASSPQTARRRQQPAHKPPAKKKKRWGLRILAAVACLMVALVGGGYWYLSYQLNAGNGSITNSGLTVETPPELTANQMNILVLGLDYEDEDAVERNQNTMMADMILYVQYDKKAQTVKMLQIPRDSFVVTNNDYDSWTNGTGKINGLYSFGPNRGDNAAKVSNIVRALNEQLQLKVDHYITIELKAFREMIDAFGGEDFGLEVYVPVTMEYNGSRLEQGYHYLQGAELEFFLRQRKDPSATPRGDIDRLDNQKYFYAALFKYMKTMTWQEMVKLMPFFLKYINTDISPMQCAALGVSALGVPSENITMGRLPVLYVDGGSYYGPYNVMPIAAQATADCLNTYFRPAEAPVSADQLNIADMGQEGVVIDCEMKHMAGDGTINEGAGNLTGGQAPASTSASAAAPAA